jgi:hypothetical protein
MGENFQFLMKKKLLSESTLRRPCLTDQNCTGNGEFCNVALNARRCECTPRFADVDWRCLPGVFPGEFGCEDSRQCSIFFPGATCSGEGKCHCPEGSQLGPPGSAPLIGGNKRGCVSGIFYVLLFLFVFLCFTSIF